MKTLWKTGPQTRRKMPVLVKPALRYGISNWLIPLDFGSVWPVDGGKTLPFYPNGLGVSRKTLIHHRRLI